MFVRPQISKNTYIIASLVVAIVVLVTVSSSVYSDLNETHKYMAQEKKLVMNELSEMIASYDDIDIENDSILKELEISKQKMQNALDSIQLLKPNASLISNFKLKLKILRSENKKTLGIISELEDKNNKLLRDAKRISDSLMVVDSITKSLKKKNVYLASANTNLNKDLKAAKQLSLIDFKASGVKRVTSSKKIRDTRYAGKTNKFHVSFKILKNDLLSKGKKVLYFQVLNSKMRVVANKGEVDFGRTSLIYSGKTTVDYKNEDIDISLIIDKAEKENLTKGTYFISVYHKGNKIGRTALELK